MFLAYRPTHGSVGVIECPSVADAQKRYPDCTAWNEVSHPPVRGEEILDPVTLTIVPDPDKARREKLAALSATDAAVIRGVDDLFALLVAKGVITAAQIPPDLKAKLDARAVLRADLAK